MKDEEINVAIAEACGWTYDPEEEGWFGPNNEFDDETMGVPNYASDLNAMHEAVTSQEEHVQTAFMLELCQLCQSWGAWPILTKARQRAEAFLRTVGKWKEGV